MRKPKRRCVPLLALCLLFGLGTAAYAYSDFSPDAETQVWSADAASPASGEANMDSGEPS